MSTTLQGRILAVEVRAARLGYAVFETEKQLRYFGALLFTSRREARRRIAALLRLYLPATLVLHGAGTRYPRNMRSRKLVARIARAEARKLTISVATVSEGAFKPFFAQYSCRDKYDIAAVLAKSFPELAWRIPPTPEFYEPEPRSMLYFDSIALGVAYLELAREIHLEDSDDELLSSASK